ncbi:uncharacterized protein EDB93DRAFT_1250315 [Suillus bovinus]|uniref:uncharacterized protein n=1 Tax=Suillus bovinus TaxID=48563 RepID=UPI001B871F3E|nr:uncharacterized protein EDB93DRAFT_1252083 [Suillus bovinus]XP_041307697.1 uncharacterized protein EDB93DRAFT_1250315 [Suillus bovinus]KAG2142819.1 hypothetical protein EDB93DRAFT_1252083 [Suillus bovinus]KAG2147803.1 hypothetical protein EDB93DRAFT_1250315 [Suillus bovinus]
MDLYDTLQAEFPQIDTSLLAAIVGDHAREGDHTTCSSDQVKTIRDTLEVLSNQAQKDEWELDDIMSTTSLTTPDLCDSTTTASESSSSQHSFSSPLGFLTEAFSDVPKERLKRLLKEECREALNGDVDMERVVEYILNMEHIRDLEERGIDALEDTPSPLLNGDWETVSHTKPKSTPKLAISTKKKAKGRTIKIVDMMQTQHTPSSPPQTKGVQKEGLTMGTGVDIWMQVSSLSTHLAALLPPTPPSHFASFFHSPTHATTAQALRAALVALPSTSTNIKHKPDKKSPIKKSNQDAENNTLYALLDLLQASPTFATFDAEQRETLCADARVALSAAQNRPDDALDIVWILRDLEHPACQAGIYHLPPPVSGSNSDSTSARAKLPTGPPPVQPPPSSKRKSASSPSSPNTQPQLPESWQDVPIRSPRTTQPLENSNPTNKRKLRGAGNILSKGNKRDIRELSGGGTGGNVSGARHPHFARGILQARIQRDELLREAGRAWRGPLGGEVALYYAQRAREVAEKARKDALDEARGLVEAKRYASDDKRSIDLHGTCVQEAITITTEILEEEGCSPAYPLRLITGRGTHSVGGVGVLKPAVHRALVNKGWDVRMWDGGLVVQGRERWRVP